MTRKVNSIAVLKAVSLYLTTMTHEWILYHDPVSICSIMARYTYAIRGEPAASIATVQVREEVCELRRGQQLTEHFLCDINPKGEVPVLAPVDDDGGVLDPIPDSVDITWFIASRYPGLLPKEHETEIRRLVSTMHEKINFFSLTFAGKPEVQRRNVASLESKLGEDISERYRRAIEYKIQR